MRQKLTSRQTAIYQYIRDFIRTNKYPPTRQEIATAFRFASPNAAQQHVEALEKKGWIKLVRSNWTCISRGIQLVPHGGKSGGTGSVWETWSPAEHGPNSVE